MWITPTVVYWSSLGFLSYVYVGYPLGINVLSRLRRRKIQAGDHEPTVSFVLTSYNEEARIGRKLDNFLAQDYPAEKMEVIVVSDASTDGTDEIVRSYADRNVVLERMPTNSGKGLCVNRGMELAKNEIAVLCDTRQRIDPGALRSMMSHFADDEVGAVSGNLMLGKEKGPGLYWAYEKAIRMAESSFDSVVGVSGAFYAIRRPLFHPLPEGLLLDDVFVPLNVVLDGYRVVLDPEAKFYDEEAPLEGEFARKARTLAGNYQLLKVLPDAVNPMRNRIFLQFASHKLARLVCPAALATLLLSNGVLVLTGAPGWPFYAASLAGQLTGYGLAAKGALQKEKAGKLARFARTFFLLNAAAVEGFRRYLKGDFAWTTYRSK